MESEVNVSEGEKEEEEEGEVEQKQLGALQDKGEQVGGQDYKNNKKHISNHLDSQQILKNNEIRKNSSKISEVNKNKNLNTSSKDK